MKTNTQTLKKTLNYNSIKYFLNLFNYSKKEETINYILEILKKSEEENKVLTFDKLNEDLNLLPNPLSDRNGKCMFNTKTFLEMYNCYMDRTKFVNTKIAELVRLDYSMMSDMVEKKDEN